MRKILVIITILALLLFNSCGTKYVVTEKEVPIEKIRVEYKTNTKLDSIYIHDSINVYSRGDTIFKDKIKLVYKDRVRIDTVYKTDSIDRPVYIKTTEVKEVNKLTKAQNFFNKSGLIAWAIFTAFIVVFVYNKIKRII